MTTKSKVIDEIKAKILDAAKKFEEAGDSELAQKAETLAEQIVEFSETVDDDGIILDEERNSSLKQDIGDTLGAISALVAGAGIAVIGGTVATLLGGGALAVAAGVAAVVGVGVLIEAGVSIGTQFLLSQLEELGLVTFEPITADFSESDTGITFYGSLSGDTLVSSKFDDVIETGSDDDVVTIVGGNNTIDLGNTTHTGVGSDVDRLIYDVGANTQFHVDIQEIGNQLIIQHGSNTDTVSGADIIAFDGSPAASLDGAIQKISFGDADDSLITSSGFRSGGPVTAFMGGGDDVLQIRAYSDGGSTLTAHEIWGGDGEDTVTFFDQDGINFAQTFINLENGTVSLRNETEDVFKIHEFENAVGTDKKDTITGTSENNKLSGLGGNDEIFGGDGDDVLDGGEGRDVLTGGTGSDILLGGDGNDELIGGTVSDDGTLVDDGVVDYLSGGDGDDTYNISVNWDYAGDGEGDFTIWSLSYEDYWNGVTDFTLDADVLNHLDYIHDGDADGKVVVHHDPSYGPFEETIELRLTNLVPTDYPFGNWDFDVEIGDFFGAATWVDIDDGRELVIHGRENQAMNGFAVNSYFKIKENDLAETGFRDHSSRDNGTDASESNIGTDENNYFSASGGNDTQQGGQGSDTYEYDSSSEWDTDVVQDIGSASDTDVVDFKGFNRADVSISRGGSAPASSSPAARTLSSSDASAPLSRTAVASDAAYAPGLNDLVLKATASGTLMGTVIIRDYFGGPETGIEQIWFSDARLSYSDIRGMFNTAPEVSDEVSDQTATEGEEWSFTIPADTFSDADGDALTYTASLADGSALPDWLSFDAATRTFTGTPPEGFEGDLSLTVMASDGFSDASDTFEVVIEAAADTLGENLVTNGSFEDHGALNHGGWGTFETLSGWTSPVGVIEVQERNYGTGNRQDNAVIELDAHANSTIATTVSVDAAGEYILSLDYAMRGSDVASNGFTVSVDGVEVARISPNVFGFRQLELKLALGEGDHTIELAGAGRSNSYGTVVDNVVLMKNDTFTLGENLISNGSFEDHGALNHGGWGTFESLNGWTSPDGVIEIQDRNYGTGNENGNAVVELDAHRNSLIQQTVEVSDSGPYQLSFDYAMRGSNIHTNGVAVLVDGEVVRQINPTAQGFTQSDIVLELEAGSHTIAFAAIGRSDSYGTVIDNVALHQMEEINGDGEAIEGRDAFIESVAQDGDLSGNALAYNFARNVAGDQFAFADTDAIANRTDGPVGQSVTGSNGDDLISGGAGDDLLLGGSGSDVFLFRSNDIGHDTVSDFVVDEGSDDVLSFDSSVFANFAAVLAATTQSGDDSVIRIADENSITLQNVTATQLHQDDFLFL